MFSGECYATCPDGTYPSEGSCIGKRLSYNSYLDCQPYCTQCFGPSANECSACNLTLGYALAGTSCLQVTCVPRYFLNEITIACDACHETCYECFGPESAQCLSCPYNLKLNDTQCITCDDLEGFQNPPNFYDDCSEIWGDGRNFGQFECDDGNSVSGDGCSKACKIEYGFVCDGGSNTTKDTCADILPPECQLNFIALNLTAFVVCTEHIIPQSTLPIIDHFRLHRRRLLSRYQRAKRTL